MVVAACVRECVCVCAGLNADAIKVFRRVKLMEAELKAAAAEGIK